MPRGCRDLATESPRKPPHCRTCGHRMKGHTTAGCPKAKNGPLMRQQYLRGLEQKHRGLVQVFVTSAEEVPTEAVKAEQLGFKTCVVTLDEGWAGGHKLVMLLLGENGKAVHDLANAFKKGKKDGHWTSMARIVWRAIVVISDKPWVQKAAEKLLLSLLSSWGNGHCKAE
ncbi:hypothetical protein L226DRAFT_518947 [Lentinus tigrinus ALCF2SS1-7]|uniref:Uncharacterized protein n=1 Tax=Lentinus tigrinus ALCF2SS1-6 TaxID=1328759 RepID=A0A5C2SU17_9APHY|nr:hypothetical protein L227DRAFT_559006 [Lentinus tigrinus ALCF2SS1-6]RPD80842.1 hypothetical protein L226DRAFT_518947 [Lentinus tigrinus ALCF2SS1-7]